MATLYPYDQTKAQETHLSATNPEGFCESCVCFWHALSTSIGKFATDQKAVMEKFGSDDRMTRYIRQLQDAETPSFTYSPSQYTPGSARLQGMLKYWKLKHTAETINAKIKTKLGYDPPSPTDAGDYNGVKTTVFNTIATVGNMCYLMMRSSNGGHGIGTYRPNDDTLLLFDPNQGVFECKKLFMQAEYEKNIIKFTTTRTALGAITQLAVIRAKRI